MLALRGITKRFGPLTALDAVDADFVPGEIHAVLGENGAGKTTLMNILYGLMRADAGRIELDGRPLRIRRPADARAAGMGMVHQHFMLVERMSVAENLALSDVGTGFWTTPAAAAQRTEQAARRVGLEVDPGRIVEDLSAGQRQRVEILKALMRDVTTLILDEPTAVLTPGETAALFDALRRQRGSGGRIVFISHKLAEVTSLADRVTVLRRGRVVYTGPAAALSAAELAERMMGGRETKSDVAVPGAGRPQAASPNPGAVGGGDGAAPGAAVLELERVSTDVGHPRLEHVSLRVHRGEIVGVAGVDGNGQAELARVALGLIGAASGRIHWHRRDKVDALAGARPAHIADDRQREALVLPMTVAENAVLKDLGRRPFSRFGWLNRRAITSHADALMREYDIRAASLGVAVATLSGGTQQRLVVARELAGRPALLVAVNPTRGLDAAASAFVHGRLREHGHSAGVLLISADLDELLALADRVAVLYSGRLTPLSNVPRPLRNTERVERVMVQIGRLMAGLPPSEETE